MNQIIGVHELESYKRYSGIRIGDLSVSTKVGNTEKGESQRKPELLGCTMFETVNRKMFKITMTHNPTISVSGRMGHSSARDLQFD